MVALKTSLYQTIEDFLMGEFMYRINAIATTTGKEKVKTTFS